MPRPLGLVVALTLLSCSSSPTDDEREPESTVDTSVFDHCTEFAERLCEDSQACCQQAYGDFSQEGCVATFKRDVCRPGADAVAAGRAVFDEDSIDGCLAAHAESHAVCFPTWEETLALRKRIYAECRVINGTTEAGRGCAIDSTCERPEGAATAECIKNVCRVVEVLPEGAVCPFPSGSVSVCDSGLACDAPGPESEGHCVVAIPAGEPCDNGVLEGTDCGLGSFCDRASGVCMLTTNMGGTSCEQGNQCVSFDCDRLAGECAPAPAVVSRDTCLGAPLAP